MHRTNLQNKPKAAVTYEIFNILQPEMSMLRYISTATRLFMCMCADKNHMPVITTGFQFGMFLH